MPSGVITSMLTLRDVHRPWGASVYMDARVERWCAGYAAAGVFSEEFFGDYLVLFGPLLQGENASKGSGSFHCIETT